MANYSALALRPHDRPEADAPGVASAIGNIIWLILAGWWLALGHIATGVAPVHHDHRIPLGLANFKLVPSRCSRWATRSSTRTASGRKVSGD